MAILTLTSIDFRVIPIRLMPDTEINLDRTLHAIADPTRRRILQMLKDSDKCSIQENRGLKTTGNKDAGVASGLCAGDIEERVKLSQPTISHHMAILTRSGLVEAVKHSQWRWYRRNETALRRLVKTLRHEL